jgi:hypothetical protein
MIPVGLLEKSGKAVWVKTVEGWIQVWYIWCIIKTFVNATMYLDPAQQLNK